MLRCTALCHPIRPLWLALSSAAWLPGTAAWAQTDAPEVIVISIAPGTAATQNLTKVPYAVQRVTAADLQAGQSLDLTEQLNRQLASVNLNSAQGNPLQADLRFRGFTASPLLGLPQGLSVYQNGVRVNEPLGDAVNWDLLPESAIASVDLLGGSNPVYGLNTLGGALALRMKNGFSFDGNSVEVLGGSWGRQNYTAESGGNNGAWAYYVNGSHFAEDGWRDLSDSAATNFYGSVAWRDGDRSSMELVAQQGDSDLIGNGALPVGLLDIDRSAVFTAPDITANDMSMLSFEGSHQLANGLRLSGTGYWRENNTRSFNGDASEFELCQFAGGARALFEEPDAVEDALQDDLDIELEEICEGDQAGIRSFVDLENFIEDRAEALGLDAGDYELEDISGELSGSGVLSDEAINNISARKQESRGLGGQADWDGTLASMPVQLVGGVNYFRGDSTFDSVLELSGLDPLTRSTQGLGTGSFVDEAATSVATAQRSLSWYVSGTFDLSEALALTIAGRYHDTDVSLRDQSGERPELNGDHNFTRLNPSAGLTFNTSDTTYYASWSQSSRVPTPIELACNEGVFELAQKFAGQRGEDPDDIEFECRLPNAFLADPPLNEVVTSTWEAGVRGSLDSLNNNVRYQLNLYAAQSRDDILFQTTGRATGLFANIDAILRTGFETSFTGNFAALDWYASFSHIKATFDDDFMVLSPLHPDANADGEVKVKAGNRMPGIPQNVFKLGGDYHLTPTITLGADVFYNSSQLLRGDEANHLGSLDGYTQLNLRASYVLLDNLTLFARVTNALDKEYVNFGLLGEDPTEVLPGLANRSPVFVGAGAPRAGWVGVRYTF